MAVKIGSPGATTITFACVESSHPLAYCPPGSRVVCADYLAHLLRRCTRLLNVLPSRQHSAICHLLSHEDRLLTGLRKPSVASDGGSFCTAFGSYFVLLVSCLPAGQTSRMWRFRQGSSLTWLSIRIRLQGRKPGESNKLFDLFYRHTTDIRPIRGINENYIV